MLIALPKQARTTRHVRAQIAASDVNVAVSERRCGVAAPTIYKGVRCPDVRPHTAHRVKPTLTPGLEAIVVGLRWAPDKSPPRPSRPTCRGVCVNAAPARRRRTRTGACTCMRPSDGLPAGFTWP